MPYRRNNKLNRVKKNLNRLAYRSKIGAKLSQLNTTNLFYNVREVNDIDQINIVAPQPCSILR